MKINSEAFDVDWFLVFRRFELNKREKGDENSFIFIKFDEILKAIDFIHVIRNKMESSTFH